MLWGDPEVIRAILLKDIPCWGGAHLRAELADVVVEGVLGDREGLLRPELLLVPAGGGPAVEGQSQKVKEKT